jgi:hypothetical protein
MNSRRKEAENLPVGLPAHTHLSLPNRTINTPDNPIYTPDNLIYTPDNPDDPLLQIPNSRT